MLIYYVWGICQISTEPCPWDTWHGILGSWSSGGKFLSEKIHYRVIHMKNNWDPWRSGGEHGNKEKLITDLGKTEKIAEEGEGFKVNQGFVGLVLCFAKGSNEQKGLCIWFDSAGFDGSSWAFIVQPEVGSRVVGPKAGETGGINEASTWGLKRRTEH